MSTTTTTQKTVAEVESETETGDGGLYQLTIETAQGDELHPFDVFSTIREFAHDGLENAVVEAI